MNVTKDGYSVKLNDIVYTYVFGKKCTVVHKRWYIPEGNKPYTECKWEEGLMALFPSKSGYVYIKDCVKDIENCNFFEQQFVSIGECTGSQLAGYTE